jgi:hypothetical protein
MASVQLSGVIPGVPGGVAAGAGPVASPPGGSGGGVLAAPLGRGKTTAPVSVGKAASVGAASTALPGKGQVKATAPGAEPALEAIGTQMVLVFDDQTHTMTVKMLDIETQKVVQQDLPEATPQAAHTASGPATSGTLVDTKA